MGHSEPAAEEDTQHWGAQSLAGAGPGTGHSEVVAQGVHPAWALLETVVRPQSHSVWSGVAGEPGIQAAKWTAVEVAEEPGRALLVEGQGVPG